MVTFLGANTELSRYITTSIKRPHSEKSPYPYISCLYLYIPIPSGSFSNRFPPLSAATSRQVVVESRRKATYPPGITFSMLRSSSNHGGDANSLTYKDAGVDIDAGTELVRRIANMAPGIGGFGGLFPLGDSHLVAGTDGVGTKLKLAFETGIHETIGIDLVAMSVNDIVTSGAKPLFFLDYFATSHLDVDLAEKVIKGIVDGCQLSECILLGGETAEMPGFYAEGEYDLSGFAVGIVEKDSVIDGKSITVGDVLIGLPSSGVHSNGFSLVRRVLARSGLSLKDQLPGESVSLGEALMAPTVIYVEQVLDFISKGGVKGIAHITGGGFTDNIPRVFPKGLGAAIYKDSWVVPPVFNWIQEAGNIEDAEMRRTFNMGIGMVLVVSNEAALRILEDGRGTNIAYCIGEVVNGDGVSYQCSSMPLSGCFSKWSPPSSVDFRKVESGRAPKGRTTYSMLSGNHSDDTYRANGLTYKDAGVDIDAGSELVRRIAKVAPGIGGFGGLFPLGDSYLVASTDGVGTKLKLAFETGIHETIGIDLVAMSVNDIVTSGAKPLFFLDYFATSHLDVDLAEKVIKGIVDGCQQSECTLLGGETAEMPDFYAEGEYDLSGYSVGIVKKDSVIDGKNIMVGDVLIGLPSSGVHSNGFSLVRRVLTRSGLSLKDQLPGESVTLGEALMTPTVIYVKQVLDFISMGGIKGVAHITGGGFTDNIPRVFPKGLGAVIYKDSWVVPPVFNWIQEVGRVEDAEMRRTFNMGIGMVLVVSKEVALRILEDGHGTNIAYRIGEVVIGDGVSYQ